MENMDKKEGERLEESSWVIAVESSLEGETIADKPHGALIHPVPKSLLSEKTMEFYLPQVISFGPSHFERQDPHKNDMELLKSEVARKMHGKIKNKDGLKSVIEKFKKQEAQKRIKESYAKNIELSSEAYAWMIVRDACFVLEVLDRFGKNADADKSVPAFIDSILSRKRHHPLLTEIVKDMLKMENQLPFWVLKEIRLDIEESNDDVWFESALKNLSPIEVAEVGNQKNRGESHILQMLHDYIVCRQVSSNQPFSCSIILGKIKKRISSIIKFEEVRSLVCGPVRSPGKCIKGLFNLLGYTIILLWFPVFFMLFLWGIIFVILHYLKNCILKFLLDITDCISRKEKEPESHVPTVEELRRVGVKFKRLYGDKTGINHIKFEDSTLYLPKFKVDNRSEVIFRNLIALEICSPEEEKPITRYAILMNDLVDNGQDVGILRREDIITGKLGSDDEIAKLWNSMVTPTEMPRYESIDKAALSINRYYKKRWNALLILKYRSLWAQFIGLLIEFIMVHCSRPWWFLSVLAGLLLLLFTLVQVFCLFETCQLKHVT